MLSYVILVITVLIRRNNILKVELIIVKKFTLTNLRYIYNSGKNENKAERSNCLDKISICKYLSRKIGFDRNNGHRRKLTMAEVIMDTI